MSLTPLQKATFRSHTHTTDQLVDPATGEVAVIVGISDEELAAALAALDLTPEVINNFVSNDTFVTELTESNTYVTNFLTELTELTEITQNTTYITNLITQIVAQINGKKGIASELATLDSGGHHTSSEIPTAVKTRAIEFVIDGGGSTITTGVKGDIEVPYACTITAARLLADQSGSIVVNVWKDTYANFAPTAGDKITASAPPTISSASKSQDTTLTGWTTSISAGDILRFNVDSVTTIQRVTVSLTVTV